MGSDLLAVKIPNVRFSSVACLSWTLPGFISVAGQLLFLFLPVTGEEGSESGTFQELQQGKREVM